MTFVFQERNGYSAFALYNSLKLHFSSPSYDYFKYHGKTNISESSFMKRKDKYSFYKLSRKYNLEQLKNFYISNILQTDIKWIGDIIGPDGEETYKKWQKRNESLTYRFEQDIILLFESSGNFLHVDNGSHPYLLTCMLQGDIMIETVAILNDLMGFFPMWSGKIQDTIRWPDIRKKCLKYTSFIEFDKEKMKNIILEKLK